MKQIEELHRQAMDLADRADRSRDVALLRQAFDLERAAAMLALERKVPQPSLGILFRSAASLAAECGLASDAKALVEQALAWRDEMPEELVAELEEVLTAPTTRAAP
jgi:hypothetical protein